MGISLKQAFSFVPQDKKWINKIFIGGLLMCFPCFIYIFPGIKHLLFNPVNYYFVSLFAMLIAVTAFIIRGYFFKTLHNRIVHCKGRLASWKYISYYLYIGFKAYLASIILLVPFLTMFAFITLFAPMTLSEESIPFIFADFILIFLYTAFYIMLALNFSLDFRFKSFFNIKKAFDLIKHNVTEYVILVFYFLLVAFCALILSIILINAQILSLLLPFVIFYIYMVYCDLFAQFALQVGEDKYDENKCLVQG